MGLDAVSVEVKAGMDPVHLKQTFETGWFCGRGEWSYGSARFDPGRRFRVIPVLKNGGYIFSSDHSQPSSVSLAIFGRSSVWRSD
jgi:uroporphyrinogen decarboxylase